MKSFSLCDAAVRWIEANLLGRASRVHVSGEHSGAIPIRIAPLSQLSLILPTLLPTDQREFYNLHDSSPKWEYEKQLLTMKGKFIYDKNYNAKQSLKIYPGS